MSDDYKGAWFGSAELKDEAVARMRAHRAQDTISQGVYQETLLAARLAAGVLAYTQTDTFKGCALGCLLPLQADRWQLDLGEFDDIRGGRLTWHQRVEDTFGIDRVVARAIDNIFEEQNRFEDAAEFAVAVMEAIPLGADLRALGMSYFAWLEDEDDEFPSDWTGNPTERAQHLIKELENAPIATGARAMILVG